MNHHSNRDTAGNAPAHTKAQTLYEHPDGHVISYSDGVLIAFNDEGTVFIPIGPKGLIDLGSKLVGTGMALEALATYHRTGGTA